MTHMQRPHRPSRMNPPAKAIRLPSALMKLSRPSWLQESTSLTRTSFGRRRMAVAAGTTVEVGDGPGEGVERAVEVGVLVGLGRLVALGVGVHTGRAPGETGVSPQPLPTLPSAAAQARVPGAVKSGRHANSNAPIPRHTLCGSVRITSSRESVFKSPTAIDLPPRRSSRGAHSYSARLPARPRHTQN